jgi:hypothetical protein
VACDHHRLIIERGVEHRPVGKRARHRGDEERQKRKLRLAAPVLIHHRPRLFQRGYVELLDESEMLDAAVRLGHVLGDLAAKADDLDRLIRAFGAAAARGNCAALVEDEGIEVRVADSAVPCLHLRKVYAEVAGAGSNGGRSEHVGGALCDFRLRSRFGGRRRRRRRSLLSLGRLIARSDGNLLGHRGSRFDSAFGKRPLVLAVLGCLVGPIGTGCLDDR